MAASHEQFMQKARAAFTAALKGEAGKEDAAIACALSEAYREGMKRAVEIAQAEAKRLDRLTTEAEIIAAAILSEAGDGE